MRGGEGLRAVFRRNRQAFRADEFDVVDAEESEHLAQVGLDEVAPALERMLAA